MDKTKLIIKVIDNLIWVILAIMLIIFGLVIPRFFSVRNFYNILYASSALGMIVLAQAICLITGNFDLSVESTLGFAPMIGVLLMMNWMPGLNPFIAIIVTLAIGVLIGLLNAFFVVKVKVNAFLQTLAMLIILRGIMLYMVPLSVYGFPAEFSFPGGGFVGGMPFAVILLIGVYLFMEFFLRNTRFGRSLYAVGGNKKASFIAGISTGKIQAYAFVISGLLSAIGGLIMAGRMDSITNVMGEGQAIMTFAGAILGGVSLNGGRGKPIGVLGGVLLLGVIDNALSMMGMNPYLIYATKGGILFLAIVTDQLKMNLRQKLIMKREIGRMQEESREAKEAI